MWKVILATLVIFGAGVITGGLLVGHADHLNLVNAAPPKPINLPGGGGGNPWQARSIQLLRRMDRELNLTPEQHATIENYIAVSQERTKDLWKPISQQMGKEMRRVRGLIREELTPEQQVKFDELIKPHPPADKRRTQTNVAPVVIGEPKPTNGP